MSRQRTGDYLRVVATPEQERRAQIQARQRVDAELCSRLIGMTASEATAFVEQRGFRVRSAVIGSNTAFTADMRTDRVTLFLSTDDMVVRADIG